jgi:hypothetical protein
MVIQRKGGSMPEQWVVIENTPGYLPDEDGPATFEDYADAVEYLNERAAEYEDLAAEYADDPDGPRYRVEYGAASSGNYAAVIVHDDSKIRDLGRWIAVERLEEDVDG